MILLLFVMLLFYFYYILYHIILLLLSIRNKLQVGYESHSESFWDEVLAKVVDDELVALGVVEDGSHVEC